ncbi:MAG: hypothetical protein JNK54_06545 [Elusimicrobia bacterium]|jgi:hypothetical protein|nr:hypothetical protein [Elusimicrobiota bacterium]
MKKSALWCSIGLLGLCVLMGCKNNNLFGGLHREGSGDAESLVADGQAALGNLNYAKANQYFSQALSKDPGNSEALLGQAAAQMGLSGLNFGQLISNLTAGNAVISGAPLRGAIRQSSLGSLSASETNPNSLLNQINVPALDAALSVVIVNLEKIRLGISDGKIARDDSSLLINLGLARLLKAVTKPWLASLLDIRESNGNYSVILLQGSYSEGDCEDYVVPSAYNVGWGILNLEGAALKLNLVAGSTLWDIKEDVNELYSDYANNVRGYCPEIPSSLPSTGPSHPSDGI